MSVTYGPDPGGYDPAAHSGDWTGPGGAWRPPGRHVDPDGPPTDPVMLPNLTRALLLGPWVSSPPRPPHPTRPHRAARAAAGRGRHATRARLDADLLAAGAALAGCAAVAAVLVPLTGATRWGPVWWGAGALTCWVMAGLDRRATRLTGAGRDGNGRDVFHSRTNWLQSDAAGVSAVDGPARAGHRAGTPGPATGSPGGPGRPSPPRGGRAGPPTHGGTVDTGTGDRS